MSKHTVAIVQARMSSTRLPGKVLKPLEGKLVLEHVIERLKKCRRIDDIVIATTTDEVDDQLVAWCKNQSVECFRGDRDDVLSRFYQCATKYGASDIVRVTSDNPLVDPEIVDQVVELKCQMKADYAANNIEKSFPHGLDVEVISYAALEESNDNAVEDYEREHVTQYVRHRPKQYALANLASDGDWHHIRVTLDEEDDYQLIGIIMSMSGCDVSFADLIYVFSKYPALAKINSNAREWHADYNKRSNVV